MKQARGNNTDPFVLLDLPQRPAVDLNLLENNFRLLASKYHPDQPSGDALFFDQLQAASNLLRQPALRLRFLAEETTPSKIIPAAAQELFSSIANAINHGAEAGAAYNKASGALAKALLTSPLVEAHAELIAAQEKINAWQQQLNNELQILDQCWPKVDKMELLRLATSFTFAERWQEQLKTALLELKIILKK